MHIKITPLSPKSQHIEGTLRVKNYYYFAKHHSAGIVTEVYPDDEWLDGEMAWVSRSELAFITSMRHSHLKDDICLSSDPILPIIRKYKPFYKVIKVEEFPSNEECMQLIFKYCGLVTDENYTFNKEENLESKSVEKQTLAFDYQNDLLARASSCIYKAYCLLETSHTFAEEIYINTFIALEAIIEDLMPRYENRNETVKEMSKQISVKKPGTDFVDYEEEMRDMNRNDIIHPFRNKEKRKVAQPSLMADYIFEDLAFVDWILKSV